MASLRFPLIVAMALFLGLGHSSFVMAEEPVPLPQMGDDGLYKQPWFLESFLDLREDVNEAAGNGKRLVILWEQKGCPYCKDVHTKNLAIEDINKYMRENFEVIQLNLWGDREVTDLDGEVTTEKKLARKWGTIYTPTLHFLVEPNELRDGVPGIRQMAQIMPGYFPPLHFMSMLEFVKERAYDKGLHFHEYVAQKDGKLETR